MYKSVGVDNDDSLQNKTEKVKAAILTTPEVVIPLLSKENTEEILHKALLYSKYAPSYLENIKKTQDEKVYKNLYHAASTFQFQGDKDETLMDKDEFYNYVEVEGLKSLKLTNRFLDKKLNEYIAQKEKEEDETKTISEDETTAEDDLVSSLSQAQMNYKNLCAILIKKNTARTRE